MIGLGPLETYVSVERSPHRIKNNGEQNGWIIRLVKWNSLLTKSMPNWDLESFALVHLQQTIVYIQSNLGLQIPQLRSRYEQISQKFRG